VSSLLQMSTSYEEDNRSASENNQDASEAMARSGIGLTWAYTNRRIFVGPSGLIQPMGGS